jgi:phage gp46-like protein
MVLMRVV